MVDSGLKFEIIELILLAVCILLMLSNFGLGGVVGGAVSSFFFGILGIFAYAFPILLFFGTAFCYANRDNPLLLRKIIGSVVFCWLFCAFMQLLTIGYERGAAISDYYFDSAADRLGGGVLGGILVKILGFAFGVIATYVILIIGMIIAAIMATQKPLLAPLRESGSRAYHSARERREKAVADRQKRLDEKNSLEEAESMQRQKNDAMIALQKAAREEEFEQTEIPELIITRSEDQEADLDGSSRSTKTKTSTGRKKFRERKEETAADQIIDPSEHPVSVMETGANIEAAAIEPDQKKDKKRKTHSSNEEIEDGIQGIKEEMKAVRPQAPRIYQVPPLDLLKKGKGGKLGDSDAHLRETALKLQQTLHNFGVNVQVTNVSCGPTVTRYELQPEQGVKVSRIVNLTDDIKLNLAASDIRIEAPIPGKAAVGIEVPNATNSPVMLRDLLESQEFKKHPSQLAFAAGKDIAGKPVVADIAKMPHLLIAGATGSGKSVCINTLIMSIIYKASPDDVKLIMIDPKVVELSVYNGIPHLFIPVVTDPKKAAGALNWAVAEMTDRYNKFAEYNVRDLKGYNAKVAQIADIEDENKPQKLPQIVIIVDELADLMMVAPGEVEDAICRLAQLARAAGIHLIIATQRPSVNVITGLIKANMPSRIAFSVSSGVDSRTILDMNGAEKLLGKGDMLFYPQGYQKPARLQGAFVSDTEVGDVVKYLAEHSESDSYDSEVMDKIENSSSTAPAGSDMADDRDAYFADAGKFIIEKDKASIGMLQRVFKIGFNRAARIMDQLSDAGVVGEEEGTKPRKVLMSREQFDNYLEN
ncbi:MAG: DNA translocase FtsK [Lachnospiraceae bacterium]|nr:DNA translocase FtsK [Lachnospiraceae bacterium]